MGESKRRKLLDPNYGKTKQCLQFGDFGSLTAMPNLQQRVQKHPLLSKDVFEYFLIFGNKTKPINTGCVLYSKDLKKEAVISIEVNGSCETVWDFSLEEILNQAREYRRDVIKSTIYKNLGFTKHETEIHFV